MVRNALVRLTTQARENSAVKLRKNQQQGLDIVNEIIAGRCAKNVIVSHVCPGGGKSYQAAIMARRLLQAGRADLFLWLSPRLSLQTQNAEAFNKIDDGLGYRLRVAKGKRSLLRPDEDSNYVGLSMTYQGAIACIAELREYLAGKRVFACYDEGHHLAEELGWWSILSPMNDQIMTDGGIVMPMSGTFERHEKEQVALLQYDLTADGYVIRADINYTMADCLADNAMVPVEFILGNAAVAYTTNEVPKERDLRTVEKRESSNAIRTALNTQYRDEFLRVATTDFVDWKEQFNNGAKMIVVCDSIEMACEVMPMVEAWGAKPVVATSRKLQDRSDETAEANISNFRKKKSIDTLVCVDMASEGLDVPAITHVVLLTRKQSLVYLKQAIARGTRLDPAAGDRKRFCRVFAMDTPMMQWLVRHYADQTPIELKQRMQEAKEAQEHRRRMSGSLLTPESSMLTEQRTGGIGLILTPEEKDMADAHRYMFPQYSDVEIVRKVRGFERQAALRQRLDSLITNVARRLYKSPATVREDVQKTLGKRVAIMMQADLHDAVAHVEGMLASLGAGA
jgi:superfamily II DNA or RNA helicase